MVIVCIIVAFIVLYVHCSNIVFHFFLTSHRTDLFIEVTNVTKGNTVWAHSMATGYFPTNIHLSTPILKESVRIKTCCCIFK